LCAPILIPNWVKEIEKFPRGSFVYRVLTEARDINRCDRFLLEQCCDIVLVTYTALRAMCNNAERYDQELLYSIVWHRLVADEAHVFVDATTETARDVFALQARCKIAMTGTPVRNKRIDLLTLVRFVGLEKLRDDIILMRTREQALERQRLVQRQCPLRSIHCLPELKSVTRRIELVQFVTVQEQVLYYLYAKLALQRKLSHRYNTPMLIGLMRQLCISPAVVKNLVLPRGLLAPALGVDTGVLLPSNVVDGSSSSSNGGENPIVRFMQNQPTAFRLRYKAGEAYNKTDPLYASSDSRISAGAVVDLIWDPFATLEAEFSLDDAETAQQYHFLYQQLTLTPGQLAVTTDMIASPVMADASEQKTMAMLSHLTRRISLLGSAPSSKECAVVKYVQSTPSDDRILIFSLYTGILDGLERALHKSGIECVVITGRTNAKVNSARLHQFQSQRRYKVLLMTLKLGNMGLNLTDCNHVLHADPWWNPWATEQGDFRIRRPGQLKPVFIIYFIMDHTMEVAIMNHTIRKKTLLQDMLSRGLATDGDNDQESQMSAEDESLLFDYEVTISSLCDTCAV
jgi:SNF2 family DNA or RNA helicase